jgi:hypothetical protein
MYHPQITAAAVEEASRGQGWPLVYHSEREISAAITHFEDLVHEETGDLLRALDPKEQRFIQNERRLCSLDARYYYHQYAHIVAWDKSSVHFIPNVAQQMVLEVWADLESKALAISMQQLKARQLGVSTMTEIEVGRRVQFHPRVNAVVASADPQKSRKMANMIEYNWGKIPWWLFPQAHEKDVNNASTRVFGQLDSSLLIQAGNQFTGVARGDTPNVAHLSELCEWPDPEDLVDAALLRAMHETPDLFLVLESTALGRGNWWHKTWKISKADWSSGRSRLCPIFLPWFVGVDIYPTPTWLRTRPIPPGWIPEDVTIRHAERARQYVLANPLLLEFLAKGDPSWQMSRAQMWFYEVERGIAIKKNNLNKFLQEMPADDIEAFQSTNVSAIGSEIILEYRERVPPPLGVYTIVGPHIPPELVVSRREWDGAKPPIVVRCNQVLSRCNEVYQFIPLQFKGYSDTNPMLRLFVWEWPQEGKVYGVGVDTGDGVGLDRSVAEVWREASATEDDGQVAEFASDYIKANQLWPMSLALACFYSPRRPALQRHVQCRVAIECKGNGETVQHEMKKRGWSNFHPWLRYDNKKRVSPATAHKEGVFTNVWFRAQMMDMILTKIDEGTIDVKSPWLVEEMEALERDEYKQSLKAAFGEHDDRFMAAGFIIFSMHVLDVPGRQYSRRRVEYVGSDPTVPEQVQVYATYPTPLAARTDIRGRVAIPMTHRRSALGGGSRYRLGVYHNPNMPKGYR